MDKITRVLTLYSKLSMGEEINKTVYCFENDCSPRSFDRDIEDIRLFLSESYFAQELTYDRHKNVYFMTSNKRIELDQIEFLFLKQLLVDMRILCRDELEILLSHLLSNTEDSFSLKKNMDYNGIDYQSFSNNKAILKMYGDLNSVINSHYVIKISYESENSHQCKDFLILPYQIRFEGGHLLLLAKDEKLLKSQFMRFKIENICSFAIVREQTGREKRELKENVDIVESSKSK